MAFADSQFPLVHFLNMRHMHNGLFLCWFVDASTSAKSDTIHSAVHLDVCCRLLAHAYYDLHSSAYGPTSIWEVKPSFARMVTNKCFVFCPNKWHICPNWGVNCPPPPDPPSHTPMFAFSMVSYSDFADLLFICMAYSPMLAPHTDMSFCRGSVNCHGSDGQMYHFCESSRSGEIFLDQYGGVGVFIPRDKFIRIGPFRSVNRPSVASES